MGSNLKAKAAREMSQSLLLKLLNGRSHHPVEFFFHYFFFQLSERNLGFAERLAWLQLTGLPSNFNPGEIVTEDQVGFVFLLNGFGVLMAQNVILVSQHPVKLLAREGYEGIK